MVKENQKDFLQVLGYLFLRSGKIGKALVLFEALQQLSPADPQVSRSLCYTYLLTQQYEQALSQADKFLREASEGTSKKIGYLFKSRALWGLGQKEEARRMMTWFLDFKETRNAADSS